MERTSTATVDNDDTSQLWNSSNQLSKRDVPLFTGEPIEFKTFLKAFEHVVDSKIDNNLNKLYFLEQYTVQEVNPRIW